VKPSVFIHEDLRHTMTPQSLLLDYGQLTVVISHKVLESEATIFSICGFGFSFSFRVTNRELVVERNAFSLVVPLSDIPEIAKRTVLFAAWSPGRLVIASPDASGSRDRLFMTGCDIPNITAPVDLRTFAREQTLGFRKTFATTQDFISRVYEALGLFQVKIDEMLSLDLFWDKTYHGNKVTHWNPKREEDIHPAVTLGLSDHMLLSGIQMSPDYAVSSGRLDFLFTGAVADEGLAHVCAEFKNYHSPDLLDGLERQLPDYMRRQHSVYGAYCILDFRGERFPHPNISEEQFLILSSKGCLRLKAENGLRVKVFRFRLGKRKAISDRSLA